MRKNGKVLAVAVALLVVITGSLSADTGALFVSPQRQATAELFWGDADNFIDPRGWADMEFDRWFGLVSFDSNTTASLGFASNFGGLYVALFYSGNAWNMPGHMFTERHTSFFGESRFMRTYDSMPAGGDLPDNNISLLIGTADMGFRLSYRAVSWSRTINEDFFVNDPFSPTFYRNFRYNSGFIRPELAWGMTRELVPGRGVRPHAYLSVSFHRDYLRYEQYITATDILDSVTRSNNMVEIGLTAAMGEFALARQDNFEFGLDLWYTLSLPMFNNEFNYTVNTENRVGDGFNGTFSVADGFMGISEHSHYITPYLYAFWTGERLSLAAEFGLGVGFSSGRTAEMELEPNTSTLRNHGEEEVRTVFSVNPTLGLGMQWAIVPNRLFLNAGGSIDFGTVQFATADIVNYVNGNRDNDSEVREVTRTFIHANTALSAGFTFQMTPNIGVQASSRIEVANNVVNLFSPNGFASFTDILVTVHF